MPGFTFEKRRQEIIADGLEDFVDSVEFYAAKMCSICLRLPVGRI